MAHFDLARADGRALHVTHRFAARAAEVYAAWLHPALARRWLFATAGRPLREVRIDPRIGGELYLREDGPGRAIAWRGTFTRLSPSAALAFTLAVPDAPGGGTAVEVHIAAAPSGCRLVLAHSGVPAPGADAMEARWLGALYGLGETLSARAEARTVAAPVSAG